MKKIGFGQLVGSLANVGVVIGIILLVVELSQNQTTMQAQTRAAVAQGFGDFMNHLTADPEITSLWFRGNRGEELTIEERERWNLLAVTLLRYNENVHYQYRQGLYSEAEFAGQREAWRLAVFQAEGIRANFCRSRAIFSPEYVAEIEALLEVPCE